jgi:peptide subunit release factor 1 (eRF1)
MITREALRELASFNSPEQSCVSFYFQPLRPRDQSHRDEAILIKDILKQAQREAERAGRKGAARGDLERIITLAETLNGNHSRAKAIFACEARGIWREFDLPARLARTEVLINRRFHLRPMAPLLAEPRGCVAVIDRKRARLFDVWMDDVKQVDDFTDLIPRAGRSDGFAGYEAGHNDRHIDNHAMRHYQNVCERLLRLYANGNGFDRLLLGCRDEVWGEIEPHFHAYLRAGLLGHTNLDVATVTPEQVREAAERAVGEDTASRLTGLLREVIGGAQSNGRGALGLRHVLSSLERGEVQAVVIGSNLQGTVVECTHCGHLDTRVVKDCAVCGQPTQEIEDVADALITQAMRNSAEIVYVTDDDTLAKAGGVGALLRFRADQNTEMRKVAG